LIIANVDGGKLINVIQLPSVLFEDLYNFETLERCEMSTDEKEVSFNRERVIDGEDIFSTYIYLTEE
jgi:hypothetical protein